MSHFNRTITSSFLPSQSKQTSWCQYSPGKYSYNNYKMLEKAFLSLVEEQGVLLEYGKHYLLYSTFCIYLPSEFFFFFFLSFLISSTDFRKSMYNLMNKWIFMFYNGYEAMYSAKQHEMVVTGKVNEGIEK